MSSSTSSAQTMDSFQASERKNRAMRPGLLVLIDVANVAGCVTAHFIPNFHQLPRGYRKNQLMTQYVNKISFDNMIRIIKDAKRKTGSGPTTIVDTYAVALRDMRCPPQDAKVKVVRNGPKKSIDDNILIRLFTEELTALRFNGTAALRTFVLVSGDGDYFDVVYRAVKAGSRVEIWYPSMSGLNPAYLKLREKCRRKAEYERRFELVDLENQIKKFMF